MSDNKGNNNFLLNLRKITGETQPQFARRIGISVRSVKRHEGADTLPENEAVRRGLRELAQQHGMEIPSDMA